MKGEKKKPQLKCYEITIFYEVLSAIKPTFILQHEIKHVVRKLFLCKPSTSHDN